MTSAAQLISRPVLDPNRRAHESECFSELILQKALVRKMQFDLAISEEHKRRRRDSRLRHVIDFDLLPCRNGCTLEINVFEETVHFSRRNAFPSLGRDFFQRRKDLLYSFPGGG